MNSREAGEQKAGEFILSRLPDELLIHFTHFLLKDEIFCFKKVSNKHNRIITCAVIFKAVSPRSRLFQYLCDHYVHLNCYDETILSNFLKENFGLAESKYQDNVDVIAQHRSCLKKGTPFRENRIIATDYLVTRVSLLLILSQLTYIVQGLRFVDKTDQRQADGKCLYEAALQCFFQARDLENVIFEGYLDVLSKDKLSRLVWNGLSLSREELFKKLLNLKYNPAYLMHQLPLDLIKLCFLEKDCLDHLTRTDIMEVFFNNKNRPDTFEERADLLAEVHQQGSPFLKLINRYRVPAPDPHCEAQTSVESDAICLARGSAKMAEIVLKEFKLTEGVVAEIRSFHSEKMTVTESLSASATRCSAEDEVKVQPAAAAQPVFSAAPSIGAVHSVSSIHSHVEVKAPTVVLRQSSDSEVSAQLSEAVLSLDSPAAQATAQPVRSNPGQTEVKDNVGGYAGPNDEVKTEVSESALRPGASGDQVSRVDPVTAISAAAAQSSHDQANAARVVELGATPSSSQSPLDHSARDVTLGQPALPVVESQHDSFKESQTCPSWLKYAMFSAAALATAGIVIAVEADPTLLPLAASCLGVSGLILLGVGIKACYRSQGFFSARNFSSQRNENSKRSLLRIDN